MVRLFRVPFHAAVDRDGCFRGVPADLLGQSVLEGGVAAALEHLRRRSMLVHTHPHRHRYPYDWRTKRPVIQMATEQLFVRIDSIRDALERAVAEVEFVPEGGRARLLTMLRTRSEWCISRQRVWGVPIPAFRDARTGAQLLDADIAEHVAGLVQTRGSNVWWEFSVADLLPPSHAHLAEHLAKGTDTLDVWFDSGTFWACQPDRPADLYVEGNDQYRGWFQSSLITSGTARPLLHSAGWQWWCAGTRRSKGSLRTALSSTRAGSKCQSQSATSSPPTRSCAARLGAARMSCVSGPPSRPSSPTCTLGRARSVRPASRLPPASPCLGQAAEFLQKIRNTLRFILGNLHGLPAATPSPHTLHRVPQRAPPASRSDRPRARPKEPRTQDAGRGALRCNGLSEGYARAAECDL